MQNITVVTLTRVEYEALTPDASTLYAVNDNGVVTLYLGTTKVDADALTPALRTTVQQACSDYATNAKAAAVSAIAAQEAAESTARPIAADAQLASDSAQESESWAVGGTDTRTGEDTDNAKYYAQQAASSTSGKADKIVGGTEGNLVMQTADGNIADADVPANNVAQQDGYYDKMGVGRAENLIDTKATPVDATFGFRTAAGDVSISEAAQSANDEGGDTDGQVNVEEEVES